MQPIPAAGAGQAGGQAAQLQASSVSDPKLLITDPDLQNENHENQILESDFCTLEMVKFFCKFWLI